VIKFSIILDFNDLKNSFFDKKNEKIRAEVAHYILEKVVFGV